jgi:hypothetical protein
MRFEMVPVIFRHRQQESSDLAFETLTADRLQFEFQTRTTAAARKAFEERAHPLAASLFTIERGNVVRPARRAPFRSLLRRRFRTPNGRSSALIV